MQSDPSGFELVKIDKAGFKSRFRKFLDRIVGEGRWNLDDLKEFQQWLAREDYAYKGRKWKEVFKSGAKIVSEGSQISTPLSKDNRLEASILPISAENSKRGDLRSRIESPV